MADYYPLLARALDALPDRSPAMRKAVYDRARNALVSQLRSLDPPLSEADIDLERRALDSAIERLNVEHGGIPAPANDAELASAPDPVALPPMEPPPASADAAPEIPEPSPPAIPAAPPISLALPVAEAPSFISSVESPEPEAEPRDAPIPIGPRRPRPAAEESPAEASVAPAEASEPPEAASPDPGNGRQRPRIEVVPPRGGRSRILRNAFVGVVLAVVIGLIAVAAFLLRDRPQNLRPNGTETADTQQPEGDAKFNDRVGGEAAPADRAAAKPDGAAPARGEAPPPASGVSVAQRAILIEEATGGGENAQPATTTGRATWRIETVNGEQGQPLQNAVVATVAFPDAGLTLVMTIQRNLDATLPASHTVSLVFSQTVPEGKARTVQDVGLLQAKDEESARGSPVSGLPVRVRDNLFLIGLSSLRNDVDRNTDLLLHRNWFDLAVRYTSGRRAVLTFEKGAAGARVLQSAFDAWQ